MAINGKRPKYETTHWWVMPKKAKIESQKEQSKRFLEKVQELADDGDLDLTEAEEKFELAMGKILLHERKLQISQG